MLHLLSKTLFQNRPNYKMKQDISEMLNQAYPQLLQAHCLKKTQCHNPISSCPNIEINPYFHNFFSYTSHEKYWVSLIFFSVLHLVLNVNKVPILQAVFHLQGIAQMFLFFFSILVQSNFGVFNFFCRLHSQTPISMQNFKSPPLLKGPQNFDGSVSVSVSEANASIIY